MNMCRRNRALLVVAIASALSAPALHAPVVLGGQMATADKVQGRARLTLAATDEPAIGIALRSRCGRGGAARYLLFLLAEKVGPRPDYLLRFSEQSDRPPTVRPNTKRHEGSV